jgi:glycosyltransferase involved in cell wall biosynthesis
VRLTYFIDSLASGGAQRQSVEMAVSLVERKRASVTFMVYHENDFFSARLRAAGIEILHVPKRSRYDLRFPFTLRDALIKTRPDLVHSFLLSPSCWAATALRLMRPSDRPLLVTSERNCLIGRNLREKVVQRFAYGAGDIVTANAEHVGDLIHQRLKIARDRIRYIPNGIDLGVWDQELEQPPNPVLDESKFNIGLIGRFSAQKNHLLLLRALSRIDSQVTKDWRVWFFGSSSADTSCRDEVEAEIARLSLGSIIRIMEPHPHIATMMKQMSAMVLPSIHEGFPNVVLESLASSVPVVATKVGDIENLVDDGESGFLVPSQDEEALANALIRLHELRREDRAGMGEAGRRKVEAKYPIETITDVYFDLYQQLGQGQVQE